MMKYGLFVAFLATAVPAFAECPIGKVSENGLVVTNTSPYISVAYKQSAEGLTETKVLLSAQGPKTVIATYSNPLMVTKRVSGNEILGLVYSRELKDLEVLRKERSWVSDVALIVNGGKRGQGTYKLDFRGLENIKIGKCGYAVWRIDEVLTLGGMNPISYTKYYSPALEIILRVSMRAPNGLIVSDTTYDKIEISQN